MRDDRDCTAFFNCRNMNCKRKRRQQIRGRHVLGYKEAIDGLKRELALTAQKIGEMRLAHTRLPRQQRYAERASLDSPQQLETQSFMNLGEIHLWIIRRVQ